MKTFSRVVFAGVGLFLGLAAGVLCIVALGLIWAWLDERKYGDINPGIGMLIGYFVPYGAVFGSLAGLTAGIVIPLRAEQRSKPKEKAERTLAFNGDSWHPPPSSFD